MIALNFCRSIIFSASTPLIPSIEFQYVIRFRGLSYRLQFLLSGRNLISANRRTGRFINLHSRTEGKFKVFALRKSRRKLTEERRDLRIDGEISGAFEEEIKSDLSDTLKDDKNSVSSPSRDAVLQACVVTSALMLALGAVIRQVFHVAFNEGWVESDAAAEISFQFQVWHLELIGLLVVLISTSRYILLKYWPSFAESSEAANRQVLTPLKPVDYLVVSCLPGVSEELLFRGGLLPLFGLNWAGALVAGAIFGCLHLSGGRKYSFVAWSTFVGFVYGMAAVTSSSIIVPMVSHSLNNLVGGLIWYLADEREKSSSN